MLTTLRNGTIIDGLGREPFIGDVILDDDVIAGVLPAGGQIRTARADRGKQIDVSGAVVCPGFIDMHAHSDLYLLSGRPYAAKLLQGVTTDVIGQDGLSYAPVDAATRSHVAQQIAAWNGDGSDVRLDWESVGDYLDRLNEGIPVNAAYLLPHGTIRLLVMGNVNREPTRQELSRMQDLIARGMREGAFGLSTGLTYVPAMYATTEELVTLCEIVKEHGGYFCPHHRNYGSDAIGGYRECIQIARRSGAALHFAHCHLSFDANRGRLHELLRLLDDALRSGVDLSFDSYPYLRSMTSLHSLLPSWSQAGSAAEQLEKLADPAVRGRILTELNDTGSDGAQGLPVIWDDVFIAGVPGGLGLDGVIGRTVQASAADRGLEPGEWALRIVEQTRFEASCSVQMGIEEHVRALMRHPRHQFGSDGLLHGAKPHPRAFGTFARALSTYVRDYHTLDLVEAIRQMTSSAADRLGLPDRGRLEVGAAADVVVLDPQNVKDNATYDDPTRTASGVLHVFVNGAHAVDDGAMTAVRAGRALRHRGVAV